MVRSVWALLQTKEKLSFGLLVLGILATSVMNIGGIASVMPFIEILTSPDLQPANPQVARVVEALGITITGRTVVFMGVGVIGLFLIANSLLALVTWKSIKFTRTVGYSLTVRLFDIYIRQGYAFYLMHNTADLIKNLFGEIRSIITGVLKPIVEFVVEGVLALALVGFLVSVNPQVALFAALLLGGGYGVIFILFRSMLRKASKQKVRRNKERFRVVSDAFGAIKEVKLLSLEGRYYNSYAHSAYRLEEAKARIQGIAKLPRYALEALAFGGILGLALILFVQGGDMASVLPLMSAYVVAGYKLLPALQRVFAALAQMRGHHASLELIVGELNRSAPPIPALPEEPTIRFNDRIELDSVSFTYENAAVPALNDISFTIEKNTTVGIAGPTGCGKTTLVDVILGLHLHQKGRISVDGTEIKGDNLREWRRHFGYVPQVIYLSDTTVTRNIAFGVSDEEIDPERIRFAAQLANVHEFIETLDQGYETELGERGVRLSGGQRQRIGIARALYHDPDILVFDEATSALDTKTEQAVMEAINRLMHEKTIILIAHRLSTLSEADKVVLLKAGKIDAVGSYQELAASHPHFADQ